MNHLSWGMVAGILLAFVLVCSAEEKEKALTPDLSQINDRKIWNLINVGCETAKEDGKPFVRLKPKGKPNTPGEMGLALLEGLEFTEGTIEVDLKGRGKIETSFLGVAFSAVDGNAFEAVYFRPFNFMRDDVAFRARAVQYISWPDDPWEKLRKEKPGVFESAVKPVPDPSGWFHARIEVTKKKVKVWVDDAKEPCLVVDRLASRDKGKIGLWVDNRECSFSNLKIQPAK